MRLVTAALLAATAFMLCAPAASAADMPVKAVAPAAGPSLLRYYDWSGLYLGGHAGCALAWKFDPADLVR